MLHSSTCLSLLGIVPRAEPGGALCGREALITSVNRHKNLAFVELEIYG